MGLVPPAGIPVPLQEMLTKNCLGTLSCLLESATQVSQKCFKSVPENCFGTLSYLLEVSQNHPNNVSKVFQKCSRNCLGTLSCLLESVTQVSQKCFESVPGNCFDAFSCLLKCPERVIVFQKFLKCVLKMFQM